MTMPPLATTDLILTFHWQLTMLLEPSKAPCFSAPSQTILSSGHLWAPNLKQSPQKWYASSSSGHMGTGHAPLAHLPAITTSSHLSLQVAKGGMHAMT